MHSAFSLSLCCDSPTLPEPAGSPCHSSPGNASGLAQHVPASALVSQPKAHPAEGEVEMTEESWGPSMVVELQSLKGVFPWAWWGSRVMLATDSSLTGWGAVLEGRSVCGPWRLVDSTWPINRLEMEAVFWP